MFQQTLLQQALQRVGTETLHFSTEEPIIIGNQAGIDLARDIAFLKASYKAQQEELKAHEEKFRKKFDEQGAENEIQNAVIKAQHQAQKEEFDRKINENNVHQTAKLEAQKQELEQKLKADIKIVLRPMILNGMNELISRTEQSDDYAEAREERNKEVHGADVEFHRYILDLPGYNQGMLDTCAKEFEATYGITPVEYDEYFEGASEQIIRYVNYRGNVSHFRAYTKSKHHKPEIESMREISDAIIRGWMARGASEEVTAKIHKFDELHALWKEGEKKEKESKEDKEEEEEEEEDREENETERPQQGQQRKRRQGGGQMQKGYKKRRT
jgi:hypothetical protein